MNTAKAVGEMIAAGKASGTDLQQLAWNAALACVGWSYVFGARGEYCDPVNRRRFFQSHGAEHPTIKSGCINFNGSDQEVGLCAKCKEYPGGRTRFFDCRGFTYWILKQVYGWTLQGAGATSQWNTESNWKIKGTIDGMPVDTLVCLFVKKGNKMEHTGFGYNGETVECSVGVQHFTTRNKKWTHYAVPACINAPQPGPDPKPDPKPGDDKPTLRKGDSGPYVTLLQTQLIQRAYTLPKYGIDGKYGAETVEAVKEFQRDNGLNADGICGPATWKALDSTEPTKLYTVTIQHLPLYKAQALVTQYDGCSYMKQEE